MAAYALVTVHAAQARAVEAADHVRVQVGVLRSMQQQV
jgi:hypothetical protein